MRKKSVFLETRKNERERISSMLIVVSQSCVSAVSWSGPRNRPRLIHTTSPRQRCLCVTLPLDSFPLWRRTTAVNPGSLVVIGELFINRRCRLVVVERERERERERENRNHRVVVRPSPTPICNPVVDEKNTTRWELEHVTASAGFFVCLCVCVCV